MILKLQLKKLDKEYSFFLLWTIEIDEALESWTGAKRRECGHATRFLDNKVRGMILNMFVFERI